MTSRHSRAKNWRRLLYCTFEAALVILTLILIAPFGNPPEKVTVTSGCIECDVTPLPPAHPLVILATVKQVLPSRYTVVKGDTLTKIAGELYGNPDDWGWIYHLNKIPDLNLIYVGQVLIISPVPEGYKLSEYLPIVVTAAVTKAQPVSLGGTLSCAGLQQLWDAAGGNPGDSFMAAEIAEAESGGRQYALSPTRDYGFWQINISNGALATFSAYGNARAAITLSDDGRNWDAWTTYRTGAYEGRC
jgi:hypothetical protein